MLSLATLIGGFLVTRGGGKDEVQTAGPTGEPGEVFAEPAENIGPMPFTPPVVTSAPPTSALTTTTSSATTSTTAASTATTVPGSGGGQPPAVVQQVQGGQPGLYGGSMNNTVCDVAQLISFLQETPDKAAAWAQAQGIDPAGIADYINGLTPVLLQADTRVTNYGYDNGQPVPRQALLQAGTAVLVDNRGVPRARCKCGNPLSEPEAVSGPPTYTGEKWPGFAPENAQAVTPSPQPLDALVLTDPATGTQFERPVEPSDEPDTPVTTTTLPTTTTTLPPTTTTTTLPPATTTPAPTTTVAAVPTDISTNGDVAVSSVYGANEFPASLAFDGDVTTSWFSVGDADRDCQPVTPGASCSSLLWVYREPTDVLISELQIINNAQHTNRAIRTAFGFGSVTIIITNLSGVVVYQNTISLPGSDPDVIVAPNVLGHSVTLVFEGHDRPDCGGISEFRVITRA